MADRPTAPSIASSSSLLAVLFNRSVYDETQEGVPSALWQIAFAARPNPLMGIAAVDYGYASEYKGAAGPLGPAHFSARPRSRFNRFCTFSLASSFIVLCGLDSARIRWTCPDDRNVDSGTIIIISLSTFAHHDSP